MKLEEGESIWTKVEINDEELGEHIESRREEVLERIARNTHADNLELILEQEGASEELSVRSALENLLLENPERLKTLYCLVIFMLRKKKAIQEVAKAVLSQESLAVFKNEYSILCDLYDKDPMNLMDVYLRYQVDNKPFDIYIIDSKKSSRPKTDFLAMDESAVNDLLDSIDSSDPGNMSYCWHVVQVTDATEMYIRTQADKPTLLSMLRDNVAAVLAESTILRFHRYGREVEMWSKNDLGAKAILNHIAKIEFGKGASYVPASVVNPIEKVNSFLQTIGTKDIDELQFLKFERENSPLRGSPKIMLESSQSIVGGIEDLAELGRDIISDCAVHTTSMKLRFKGREVTLSLKQSQKGIMFVAPYHRGRNALLIELNGYLRKQYGVAISLGV